LPLAADALSGVGPPGNGWRMLSCCFIQLGFAKLVEAGCWTFCLLRWYGGVPSFVCSSYLL